MRMERRYNYRRKLPHLQPDRKVFFITFNTIRRSILSNAARDIVFETCLRGDGRRYELHAVLVMPDHVHVALTPNRDANGMISLPQITHELKSISAHRINKQTGHVGRVWHEESFDRAMRSTEDLKLKIEYIIQNPMRAGLVNSPGAYRWLWTEDQRPIMLARTGGAPVPPSIV
jgi:putative transposase